MIEQFYVESVSPHMLGARRHGVTVNGFVVMDDATDRMVENSFRTVKSEAQSIADACNRQAAELADFMGDYLLTE